MALAISLALALHGGAQAQSLFPAVVDVSTLDGQTGFRIESGDFSDQLGWSVSDAGDVNNDGFGDFIVGAPRVDVGSAQGAGISYLVFGRPAFPASIDSLGLTPVPVVPGAEPGLKLLGIAPGDRSGHAVGGGADINGDGIDDVLIGSPNATTQAQDSRGSSYLVFGRSGSGAFPRSLDLSTLDGTTGLRIDGFGQNDRSGFAVSLGGDFNGDGVQDLIIGAPDARPVDSGRGIAYVVFGRTTGFGAVLELGSLDGTTGFRVDSAGDNFDLGHSVDSIGDVNGDGIDDLIIGDPDVLIGGRRNGSAYVIFGNATGFAPVIDLMSLNGSNGFRLAGEESSEAGASVAAAGDVNGDGLQDLVIGAPEASPDGNKYAGSAYVVFGRNVALEGDFPATLALGDLDGTTGFRMDGALEEGKVGSAVGGGVDLNGDGLSDLLLGAADADSNGNSSGSVYVLFGRDTSTSGNFPSILNLSTLDGNTGFRIDAAGASDRLGRAISGLNDINGDGINDLVVGAPYASPGGEAYVLFGRSDSLFGDRFKSP